MRPLRVSGAQINPVVGDLDGNADLIADAMEWAEGLQADVLLLPELALCGYPPEDLVLRAAFLRQTRETLDRLAARSGATVTVVGFVDRADGFHRGAADAVDREVANAAAVLRNGRIEGIYHKVLLPNYGVFDEDRYFAAGVDSGRVWSVGDTLVGVSICEDIWRKDGPPRDQADAGAQVLMNINASPYHRGKMAERLGHLRHHARTSGIPVVYLNQVGGQDELVFDGSSMIVDSSGRLIYRAPAFEEARFAVDIPLDASQTETSEAQTKRVALPAPVVDPGPSSEEEEVYRALACGLGDYVQKNGFTHVLVGLSGGVDSALTATIAVDALGSDRVWGLSMPSRFSSQSSVSDATDVAGRLGIRFDVLPIEPIYSSYLDVLKDVFADTDFGVAEENLQARIRGALLMAISNKFGAMVVATGNKSELAVGYATLYGDMVGGYAVLKDVLKTMVYRLAKWRNAEEEVIPPTIMNKAPSAELRPDQLDTDTLPPYDVLDQILIRYVEDDLSTEAIVDEGFDAETVGRVAGMVDRNEYKRRQAAPGVKITRKAFGKDRRLPITNRFSPG